MGRLFRGYTAGRIRRQSADGLRSPAEERPAGEVEQWERFHWGLWWSGLRLEEGVTLSWDDPRKPHIDLNGEDSTITIPGECQKSGKDTVGPIVPEFYEFLMETPEEERTGLVFKLLFHRKDTVSKVLRAIGARAGIKVSPTKFVSAHDFRRSFGHRWAMRVLPVVLQRLMRHANIETTLKFYAPSLVREESKVVWQAYRATVTESAQATGKSQRGHILGNS